METMYHGNGGTLALHPGLCLTDDDQVATDYAVYDREYAHPVVHQLAVDFASLRVVEVDGYSSHGNISPGDGDSDADVDADVIAFTDQTIRGRSHTTWRFMTAVALAAITVVATTTAED